MIDKRKTQLLVGETDALFQQPGPGVTAVALMAAGALFFITLGIMLEASN